MMVRSLHTAATGMQSQQLNVDTIANNLSNSNTVGFKKSRIDFEDLMYQILRLSGAPITAGGTMIPTGIEVGLGTRPAATQKIFSEGVLQQTGNPLDIAIEGIGFFRVTLPDGSDAYTRDGSFKMDSEGNVVTSDGYRIQPSLVIPPDAKEISISVDGTVSVTQQGSTDPVQVGNIELSRFVNPAGLTSMGQNLFLQSGASGEPTAGTPSTEGFGTVAQGFLENSNVQVVEEMVNMIIAQRAYDMNSKVILTSDEMLQTAANLRR